MRARRNPYHFIVRKFPTRMQKKLVMLFMAIVLAFVVLVGRITYINATKGSIYTRIVLDQQAYDSRVIPYRRGDIVDRNGIVLATSERVYNVVLDVYVLTARAESVDPTIRILQAVFELEEDYLRRRIGMNPTSRYEVLAREIPHETYRRFRELMAEETYANTNGVWFETSYRRFYPHGELAAHVLGFANSVNEGNHGIELRYSNLLNGVPGREFGYFAADATLERTLRPPQNGHTIVSTIDFTIQSLVEHRIREFNEAHRDNYRVGEAGSLNTAVLVVDPNTGEILAMATYPDFDLNNPRDLTRHFEDGELAAKTEEEKLNEMARIWRNFCITYSFEPGSTAKAFTIAMALETGVITGNELFHCSGSMQVGVHDIRCWVREGHGTQSVTDIMAFSCNVGFMQIGMKIGIEDFVRYQQIFGMGKYTGIDLPGEASVAGLMRSVEEMQIVDLVTNAFGQNFNLTMVQMVTAFSSLINGGYYFRPFVVRQVVDEFGRVVQTNEPVIVRKTISHETSATVREHMEAVVDYGTGVEVYVLGVPVAGKTGTAEKLPRDQGNYLLSFIGYAPRENPQVVIYVIIDEPNVADQTQGFLVRELTRLIMRDIFPHLNLIGVEIDYAGEGLQDDESLNDGFWYDGIWYEESWQEDSWYEESWSEE